MKEKKCLLRNSYREQNDIKNDQEYELSPTSKLKKALYKSTNNTKIKDVLNDYDLKYETHEKLSIFNVKWSSQSSSKLVKSNISNTEK